MSVSIETRFAEMVDAPAIAQLVRPLWVEHAERASHLQRPEGVREFDFTQHVESSLSVPNEDWILAFNGTRAVGTVRIEEIRGRNPLYQHSDMLIIDDIAVAPDWRRRGVAGRLLQDAESIARSRGIALLQAMIYRWNKPSIGLFEDHGFRQTRSDYFKTLD